MPCTHAHFVRIYRVIPSLNFLLEIGIGSLFEKDLKFKSRDLTEITDFLTLY